MPFENGSDLYRLGNFTPFEIGGEGQQCTYLASKKFASILRLIAVHDVLSAALEQFMTNEEQVIGGLPDHIVDALADARCEFYSLATAHFCHAYEIKNGKMKCKDKCVETEKYLGISNVVVPCDH